MRRRVAVLTTGRQDYGVLRSTLLALDRDPEFELLLVVAGMHLDPSHGMTASAIAVDGLKAVKTIPCHQNANSSVAGEMAVMMVTLSEFLQEQRPDCLVLVGDRYETAAAALAATVACVPLVHLHGGEETEGAFDNQLRHAITKMSHLHLVSHPRHMKRVIQMGEPARNVHLVGTPGWDNLLRGDLPCRDELEQNLGIDLCPPLVIVSLHPATLSVDGDLDVDTVIGAIDMVEATYVVMLPNSDPGSAYIRDRFESLRNRPRFVLTNGLGPPYFWALMSIADAFLGNSSSALIEAPLLGLPSVNVGERQRGRTRFGNVLDVPADTSKIAAALREALSGPFREKARAERIRVQGQSAERVLTLLRRWNPPSPPAKRFIEIEDGHPTCAEAQVCVRREN